MPEFNAGAAVDPVKWDFTAYLGKDAKGVFDEPTQDALDEYNSAALEFLGEDGLDAAKVMKLQEMLGTNPSEAQVLAAGLALLPDLDEDTLKELRGTHLRRVKRLCEQCNGAPTPEQVDLLPGRVQEAFAAYIQQTFGADPTQLQAAVSTPSLAVANGAGPTT